MSSSTGIDNKAVKLPSKKKSDDEIDCLREGFLSPLGFMYTLGGCTTGVLLSGFMPRGWSKMKRMTPFYILGGIGILIDDYRVRETCKLKGKGL